ncbi:MAG TPA: DUF3761 domain-containing protein [Acidimicrobiales bacterium]|nr:DUF3761 domain-containing protein [Acidimicrobiales bacterium]
MARNVAVAVACCLAVFGLGAAVGSRAGIGDSGPPTTTTTLSPDDQAIVDGNLAKCNDLSYSDNASFGATCSSHGGVRKWLATYGRCADGEVIRISDTAKCGDHGGFDKLLPAGFVPTAAKGDLAECNDGTFSDNTDFDATCSSHQGLDRWLAPYARCTDGTVIKLARSASCDHHGGFGKLMAKDYTPPTTTTTAAATTTTAPPPPPPPTTTAPIQPLVPPTTAPYVPPTDPPSTAPPVAAGGGHTARCNDGTYSDAAHHQGACSHHGGVAEWYK